MFPPKVECAVCKKKFKNETSKNYHEMFHTQEERNEANGISKPPTKSRADDLTESDSDSEILDNRKTKKAVVKAKEDWKKTEKEVLKTKPEMVKAEAAKILKKRFSEASEDSDNACDSNYLSLKHISMSIKKQDERRGVKDVSSTPAKPLQKQVEVPPSPAKAALPKTKSQPKLPVEPAKEEKKVPTPKPEPKPVTKQKPKVTTSEPVSSKKVKLTCDQCKKKFSEIMALEYHKITFHAEVAPSSPTPIRASTISVKSTKPTLSKSQKDQRTSNAKTKHVKESDDSESESESDVEAAPNTPEPEMKRYADEKNKLSALSGIFNKKRFSSSSEPLKKGRDSLKYKTDKKETVTKVKPVDKPRKIPPKALKPKIYTECDSESESDQKSPKEAGKQKAKPKKPIPAIDSDSDSEPVGKSAKTVKKKSKVVKPKQPELKEDEDEKLTSDGEEKEKYKKVPCKMCGRQMANEFVLQYHLVRCPGV